MMKYERTVKERPKDTVVYEIRMLRFCFQQISKNSFQVKDELYVYLESYLLHYRNLIEFLRHGRGRSTDVSVEDVVSQTQDEMLTQIRDRATELSEKHWQDISQYLQHLTDRRHLEKKSWEVNEMFEELNPILTDLETLLSRI